MKRKKRLERGIESLKEVIKKHEKKLRDAIEEGKEELANYYSEEIKDKEREIEKKKSLLKR